MIAVCSCCNSEKAMWYVVYFLNELCNISVLNFTLFKQVRGINNFQSNSIMIRQQFLLTAGEIREILHENDCILQINKTHCATDPCYAIGVFIFHFNLFKI